MALVKFYLTHGFQGHSGDPGLAITDEQSNLFPVDFVGSLQQITGTIGLEVPISGSKYYNVTLGDGIHANLVNPHPLYPDCWLLYFIINSSVNPPESVTDWAAAGKDVQFLDSNVFWRDLINSSQV